MIHKVMKQLFILICMLLPILSFGQGNAGDPSIQEKWKEVERLISIHNYEEAKPILSDIKTYAKRTGNDPMVLRAFLAENRLLQVNVTEDQFFLKIDQHFQQEISTAKPVVKSLLQFFYAEFLNSERRFRSQSDHPFVAGNDSTKNKIIDSIFQQALENKQLLKKEGLTNWQYLLTDSTNQSLTPTLFHQIGLQYINFLPNMGKKSEPKIQQLADEISTLNRSAGYTNAEAYLAYRKLMLKPSNNLQKALLQQVETYKSDFNAFLLSKVAELLAAREKYVEALAMLEQAKQDYANSPWLKDIEFLENVIKMPSLGVEFKYEQPTQSYVPFFINFRNTKDLYIRVYNITNTPANFQKFTFEQDSASRKITTTAALTYEESVDLDREEDYKEHKTIYKLNPLKAGNYMVLVSNNKDFIHDGLFHTVAKNPIIITDQFSYLEKRTDKEDNESLLVQLINRNDGQPYSQRKIQIFHNTTDSTIQVSKTATTNKQGLLIFKPKDSDDAFANSDFLLYLEDEKQLVPLNRQSARYNYVQDYVDDMENIRARTISDRAIYRPGQTVYFKSIIYTSDFLSGKVLEGQKITAKLVDGNGQHVDSLTLTSNSFGSIHGELHIPKLTLNGGMRIEIYRDKEQINAHFFRVEEYKRPTFKVLFDTNEETYTRTDTAVFSGKVETFSGVNLSGATVNYKVNITSYGSIYRQFQLQDSTVTVAEDGRFNIRIPLTDTALTKLKSFSIQVTAEVVNQTGEMQQAVAFYQFDEKPWRINILTKDREEEKKWATIHIDTKNQNGQPLKFAGKVNIYKFQEPEVALPPQTFQFKDANFHILDKKAYKEYFPLLYDDTRLKDPKKTLVKSYTFDTNDTSLVKLDAELFDRGAYLVEAISMQGKDTVTSTRTVEVYAAETHKITDKDFLVANFDKTQYKEGDRAKITFYSDVKEAKYLYLYTSNSFSEEEIQILPFQNGKSEYSFSVTREHIALDFNVSALLIVNNLAENIDLQIPAADASKKLKIRTKTFRDKILPGKQETWSFEIRQDGKVIPAEVLATMYDASLDEFQVNYIRGYFETDFPHNYQSKRELVDLFYWSNYPQSIAVINPIQMVTPLGSRIPMFMNYGLWRNLDWENYNRTIIHGFSRVDYSASAIESDAVLNEVAVMGMSGKVAGLSAASFEPAAMDELHEPTLRQEKEAIKDGSVAIDQVVPRTNLKETAFFYPNLTTDKDGLISFDFTTPEALTKWKLQLFAHGKKLEVGEAMHYAQTQKQLMVQPNLPRYFRENDEMILKAQVQNLSDGQQKGQAKIAFINPVDHAEVTKDFVIDAESVSFDVKQGANQTVSWKIKVPAGYPTVQVKIVAASDSYSDGEVQELAVLNNSILISETQKLTLKPQQQQELILESAGKENLTAKVQVQSNPILEIISALDYLNNYPYDCTEQQTSRWFALKMVEYIGSEYPAIANYFKAITERETKGRLADNSALASLSAQEMPWIRDMQADEKKLAALAELFNSNIHSELQQLENKLQKAQLDNGAFPWFEGGSANTAISIRILEVAGKALQLKPSSIGSKMQESMKKLIQNLDADPAIFGEKASASIALDYLYARHFWHGVVPVPAKAKQTLQARIAKAPLHTAGSPAGIAAKAWIVNQLFGAGKEANELKNRIMQEVIYDENRGMYWESNSNHYNDISLHSYLLEAYKLYDPTKLNAISQWIFYKKEANYWRSTWMTVDAIYSLLLTNNPQDFRMENNVQVLVDRQAVAMDSVVLGQTSKTFTPQELQTNTHIEIKNNNDRSVYGGLIHQFFLPLDQVEASTKGLKVSKVYQVERKGEWVESKEAKIGEKIRVVLTVINDEDLQYVHLKDSRPSGVEPVFRSSGYHWREGYYFTLKDASTNYFFDYLPKGKRTFTYEVKANNIGAFNSGITQIEGIYDPTTNARSGNIQLQIVE